MWQLLETCHAVTYFHPAARAGAENVGLSGFWPGYVTMRAAPLGAVGPAVVHAVFYGFHPDRISATLPAAWDLTNPQAMLFARADGVDTALRELWGELVESTEVAAAAELAWAAAAHADVTGRPLAAANQAVERPEQAHLALWQAATTLREHRGDGHVAVLTALGVHPVEAMLLKVGAGESEAEPLRLGRKWSVEDWQAGQTRARDNGWLDEAGRLTEDGAALHADIEETTDAAAAGPWDWLGPEATAELDSLLVPLAARIVAAGLLPEPNPIGLPLPRADA